MKDKKYTYAQEGFLTDIADLKLAEQAFLQDNDEPTFSEDDILTEDEDEDSNYEYEDSGGIYQQDESEQLMSDMLTNELLQGDLEGTVEKEYDSLLEDYNTEVEYKKINAGVAHAGAQKLRQHLIANGLSEVATAGILGNIERESGFNSGIYGDKGTSRGLFQHHGSRMSSLNKYLAGRGLDQNDPFGQIDFTISELKQSGLFDKLNSAKSKQEAADLFVRKFERPANVDNESKIRQAYASKYQHGGSKYVYAQMGVGTALKVGKGIYDGIIALNKRRQQNIQNKALGQTQLNNFMEGQLLQEKEMALIENQFNTPDFENYGLSGISNRPYYRN